MATITIGTTANNTLTGLVFNPGGAEADFATINAAIKGDSGPAHAPSGSGYLMPGSFDIRGGRLYFPGRIGSVILLPGDIVAVGPLSGWPLIISQAAAATADYVHT